MTYNEIYDKLRLFELHDLPVKALLLNFQQENIQFTFEFYNEQTKGYDEKVFIFRNVQNINIPPKQTIDYYELELTSWELTPMDILKYKIELIFTQGFSKPNWSILFEFSELEIVDIFDVQTNAEDL